jgi:membrane dipeptidase
MIAQPAPNPPPLARDAWVDGHLDLAYLALGERPGAGRDLLRRVPDRDAACVSLPDLADGPVRIALATIFTELGSPDAPCGYRDADDLEGAHAAGRRQLDWYLEREAAGDLAIVRSRADLARAADSDGPLAIVILMEGADPIRTPDEAAWWFERGVRAVGLTWARGSRYAGGNAASGPLTANGARLVATLDACGMLHDASHLCDEAFDGLAAVTPRMIVASHSNPRTSVEVDSQRHLTDAQVRTIAERDGVCGLNVYGKFLAPATRAATLADARRAVAGIEILAGSRRVAALGSDWDGGFTPLDCPEGLRHPSQLAAFAGNLATRLDLDDAAIGAFRSGNWLRVLRASLPA